MIDIEKIIGDLIDGQSISYIASIDDEGYPNMKAMLALRKRESLKIFYFTTNTSSMRVKQFIKNPKASIYFCNPNTFRGIMLKGNVEVLTDQKHKEMIWKDGDSVYYSEGVTDPDYCVLKFTAESGRYYSNFKSESFDIN